MNRMAYFLTFLSCMLLVSFGTTSFAFECVGPEDQNCQECHLRTDMHVFHLAQLGLTNNPSDCLLCHCGDPGTSECEDVPQGPVETICCTSCHPKSCDVNNHISKGGNCADCHIETNIGIDDDCDGICNPGISDASCDGSDNCSVLPNGPNWGTCTSGVINRTCVTDKLCGDGGFCSMDQEDTYPPGGNSCGDLCECEGNFDGDQDCDGTDAATFKADFGRSLFSDPCTNEVTCSGDFDCDVDVDGTDAALFKKDFGRSQFSNPCPLCEGEAWCVYE